MITTLADSYRALTIQGMTPELLDNRSKVIKQIVAEKDFKWMLESIRLFLNKQLLSQDFKTEMTALFLEADPLFKQRDNDLELRVLCGAVLKEVVDGTKNKEKIRIALALVAGFFNLKSANIINKDVIDNILKYLQDQSLKVREWEEKKNSIALSIDPTLTEASHPTIQAKLTLVNDQFKKLSQYLTEKAEANSKRILVLEEESNVHWWIFRGYSNIYGNPIKELSPVVAPIVIGKELCRLTNIYPFPPAYEQFLSKVLKDAFSDISQKISLKEAVNSVDDFIKSPERLKFATELGNICPLLYAYSLQVASGNANGWTSIFEKSTGIKADTKISAIELARQSYFENLIVRSLH